jgi:hypothetical protein
MALQVSSETKSASKPFGCTGTNKMARTPLGVDFQPNGYSVICARGQSTFNHVGNRRFRILTGSFLESYSRALTKSPKSAIVSNIVATIRQAGGNFCKNEKGAWFDVGDHCAREKVSTLLRDLLHTQYRSSGKAKLAHRKAQKLELSKKPNRAAAAVAAAQFPTVTQISHQSLEVPVVEGARLRYFGTGLNLLANCVPFYEYACQSRG